MAWELGFPVAPPVHGAIAALVDNRAVPQAGLISVLDGSGEERDAEQSFDFGDFAPTKAWLPKPARCRPQRAISQSALLLSSLIPGTLPAQLAGLA